jgi:LytS/YehU family sensor histidine kinase
MEDRFTYNTTEDIAGTSLLSAHFIFNAMAAIQGLMNENKIEEANKCLSDFGKLIRMSQSMLNRKFISVEAELGFLDLYVAFEQLRVNSKIRFTAIIDPSIDRANTFIPANIIRPALEHAFWRSAASVEGQVILYISMKSLHPLTLRIRVVDNGEDHPRDSDSIAKEEIQLLKHRLKEIIGNTNAVYSFSIRGAFTRSKNNGCRVEYTVPVLHEL